MKLVKIVAPNAQGPMAGYAVKVIDPETGEEMKNVAALDVRIRPDEAVTATIHLYPAELDIVAEAAVKDLAPSDPLDRGHAWQRVRQFMLDRGWGPPP